MQEGFDEFWIVGVTECEKIKYFENRNFVSLKTIFFFFAFHELVTRKLVASLLTKCANALGIFLWVKFES